MKSPARLVFYDWFTNGGATPLLFQDINKLRRTDYIDTQQKGIPTMTLLIFAATLFIAYTLYAIQQTLSVLIETHAEKKLATIDEVGKQING